MTRVPGHLDGDDDVEASDFVAVRDQVGVETLGCLVGDIDGDGVADGADVAQGTGGANDPRVCRIVKSIGVIPS